jgi:hypothetical protein
MEFAYKEKYNIVVAQITLCVERYEHGYNSFKGLYNEETQLVRDWCSSSIVNWARFMGAGFGNVHLHERIENNFPTTDVWQKRVVETKRWEKVSDLVIFILRYNKIAPLLPKDVVNMIICWMLL